MGKRIQAGARIDKDVYERFKEHVQERYGDRRGAVGKEMERALENYMAAGDSDDPLRRIEDDVASTKAAVADLVMRIDEIEQAADGVEADGGGGTLSNPASHTHTAPRTPTAEADTDAEDGDAFDEAPHAKAPKSDKAAYVFASLDVDGIVLHPNVLRTKIGKTWSFGDRATEDLVERIFDRYHAKAVQGEESSTWQVALGKTPENREAAIDDFGENKEAVYVAEQDGTHAEGGIVIDVVD
jgi:hypothetical protein